MAKGDKIVVTGYFDPEQKEMVDVVQRHYDVPSMAEVIRWLVREKYLEIEGKNTKDAKLDELITGQKHIDQKLNMVLLLVWRLESDGQVTLTAEEVKKFKDALRELFENQ